MTQSSGLSCRNSCPVWLKPVLSLMVLGHFLAIFFSVTGLPNMEFKGPRLCESGAKVARYYLEPLLLDCSYRFYAPNPGPNPCFWLRLHFENGQSICVEFPRFRQSTHESRFVREMNLVDSIVVVPSSDGRAFELTPPSAELLCSYAVRVFKTVPSLKIVPEEFKLSYIDFYQVYRNQPGLHTLQPDDNLLRARYHGGYVLGRYDDSGTRVSGVSVSKLEINELIESILKYDIQPYLNQEEMSVNLPAYAAAWPTAVDLLLRETPEFRTLHGEALSDRLRELVTFPL